jgi:hypothetical protein
MNQFSTFDILCSLFIIYYYSKAFVYACTLAFFVCRNDGFARVNRLHFVLNGPLRENPAYG